MFHVEHKKKKNILFLCQFFYPEFHSTAALPYDIALALSRAGFNISVMCGYPREFSKEKNVPITETKNNIFIKRLKYFYLGRKSFLGRLISYFSFTLAVLMRIFYCKKFDAILVFSNPPVLVWAAYLANVLFGCKIIFTAYDLYPEIAVKSGNISENGLISRVMRYINKKLYSRAEYVVAISDEMREFILKNRTIAANKVVVIRNWYEDRGEIGNKKLVNNIFYNRLKDKTVVCYLGNMGLCQDIATILDAAKKCRPNEKLHFLFAGHGCRVKELKTAIKNEGLKNVSYHGFLHKNDYLDALKISEYAVVSLIDGLNGLCVPSKTYAYMMANLKVIAILDKNSEIAKDIDETNSGIVIKNGESDKLLSYLRGKHPQAALRERYLQKYTSTLCLKAYVSLFECLK